MIIIKKAGSSEELPPPVKQAGRQASSTLTPLFSIWVGHFRRKGLISDEHGNLGGRNGIECRVVRYAGGRHSDDYLGIRGDDALDEFGLQHVLVSGAMLGGVAVRRQHDHVNAQGPGRPWRRPALHRPGLHGRSAAVQ